MRRVIAVAVCAALLAGCDEDVLHDLDETRANRARMVIERAGVPATKKRSGSLWTVSVSGDDVVRALSAVEQSRILVRDAKRGGDPAAGMVPSRAERARAEELSKALALEDTLEQIPGVLEARVHLQLAPENSLGLSAKARPSAAVLLAVSEPPESLPEDARRIVAGGSGVPAEAVAVVVSEAPPIAAPDKRLETTAEETQGMETAARAVLFGALVLLLGLALRLAVRTRPPAPPPLRPGVS